MTEPSSLHCLYYCW